MLDKVRSTDALNPKFRSHLRLVEAQDAEYIYNVRTNSRLNRFLTPTTGGVAEQRQWINRYKDREREGLEYYFMIVSDGQDRGVVRIYDLHRDPPSPSFEWGSWIIAPPRIPGLAWFSMLTMYEIGFDTLGFSSARLRIVKDNIGVRALHERAGAFLEREDEEFFYLRYPFEAYASLRESCAGIFASHRAVLPKVTRAAPA